MILTEQSTTYTVEYDPDTSEWVATADDCVQTFDCAPLAYLWMSQQILADE